MISQDFIDDVIRASNLVEIITAAGVDLRKSGGNFVGLCPFHDDRTPSFSVIPDKQFYYCHACQASGNALTFLTAGDGLPFPAAVRELATRAGIAFQDTKYSDFERAAVAQKRQPKVIEEPTKPTLAADWRELWGDLRPIESVAADYLLSRGCFLPPANADLRFAPALSHPSGYVGPALVGLVTDALTKEPITLHRTWIEGSGKKAKVSPPRMLLRAHRKQGGVIRLWPDEDVGQSLAIAEGIETALTLAHAFKPVWSVIDAGNMSALPVINGIRSLLIAADHDEAGIRASKACAAKWHATGVEVRIAQSPNAGEDLNDLARDS